MLWFFCLMVWLVCVYLYSGLLLCLSVEYIGGICIMLLVKCMSVVFIVVWLYLIGCVLIMLFFVLLVVVCWLRCIVVLYVLLVLSKFCENFVVLLKYSGNRLEVSGLSVLVWLVFFVRSRCFVWINVLLFDRLIGLLSRRMLFSMCWGMCGCWGVVFVIGWLSLIVFGRCVGFVVVFCVCWICFFD